MHNAALDCALVDYYAVRLGHWATVWLFVLISYLLLFLRPFSHLTVQQLALLREYPAC